jgi:hypothetical protein
VAAVANFCGECGTAGTLPELAWCENCITHERVKSMAAAAHEVALRALRHADRANVLRQLNADRANAEAALAGAREPGPALEAARAHAVAAEREKADKAREAAEHHTRCKDALHRAERDDATPEAETEARMRAVQASETARRRAEVHEAAIGVLRDADTALEAHRAQVRGLEDAAAAARKAAATPPDVVPVSMDTCLHANPLTVLKHALGDVMAMGGIMAQVEILATATGQKDQWVRDGKKEGRDETEAEIAKRPVVVGNSPDSVSVHGPRILPSRRA